MNKVLRKGYNFYIQLEEGLRAEINCERDNNKLRVVSSHTPKSYRGQGLASEIMNKIVSYAKKNNLEIVPECSFAEYYCKEREC